MPYRLRAGSWQPARLRRHDHQLILVWLAVTALIRGLDYLTGADVWGARDFMLAAAPEWVWGSGFVAGAAILTVGVTTRRHLLVYVGHGWLASAYLVNAAALALSTSPWAFNGIRGAGATGLVAIVHAIYAARTGARPLRVDRGTRVAEAVVRGE